MNDTVIEMAPGSLAGAAEEKLLGHVSFTQNELPDMGVDRRDGL